MIPFFDLTREYRTIAKELNFAFTQTAKKGIFILGKNVSLFEKEFGRYIHSSYTVGLASGTDALTLGLKALGIGSGDEVILPANSYPSAFGVALTGITMKLVDVKDDGTMDPAGLYGAITRRTRAVIPVHLYGNPADLVSIKTIIRNKKIFLVEDAAQAHGTKIVSTRQRVNASMKNADAATHGRNDAFIPAGSVGDIGCFSFYPTKNLGALGDAGVVVTNNKGIADRLMRLRMYGETKRYESVEISGVSRLDELHAAFLRVKLKHLAPWVARRREIAKQYIRGLTGIGDLRFVTAEGSSCHLFVIRTKFRDRLEHFLTARGIGTAIHYPLPIHLVPSFRALGYKKGDFPVSEALSREVLSLPMFPELTDREVQTVIHAVKKYFSQ